MSESKIVKLHGMLANKEISCTELTQTYIDAIQKDNAALNAYVTVTPETALSAARTVDEKIAKGETIGLLEGIPMTLKDNISTDGIKTTCCSKILEDYVPIYDAVAVRRFLYISDLIHQFLLVCVRIGSCCSFSR